jgi:DNA-directed RNA polymerase subunit M/transcription elongation factor TFIIS
MIKFKSCPRCRGDLYLAEDIFGKYLSCLQCGYLRDLDPQPVPPARGLVAAGQQRQTV